MMPVLIYEAKFIDLRRLSRDAIFHYDIAGCVIRKLGWRLTKSTGRYCTVGLGSTYLGTYRLRYMNAIIKQIKEVSSADVFQYLIRQ